MISPQRLFPYIIFLCIIQATFDSDASQLLLVASTVPVQCFSDRTTVTEPKQNHAIDVPYFGLQPMIKHTHCRLTPPFDVNDQAETIAFYLH